MRKSKRASKTPVVIQSVIQVLVAKNELTLFITMWLAFQDGFETGVRIHTRIFFQVVGSQIT
jgi:hypothetical protein